MVKSIWKMSFKCNFGEGRFHMLPQSYTFSHALCLNNFLQVRLIDNQRYQVLPFRYINWADEVPVVRSQIWLRIGASME